VLLDVEELKAGYGAKQVVFDASFHVAPGEIVGIIGHNGAGKTTSLRSIFGMLPTQGGTVTYHGEKVTGRSCRANVRDGMAFIPSEQFVFAELSVHENLLLGALHERDGAARDARLAEVHEIFPILEERKGQVAGTFSGGQQRILSLGMALMSNPRLLLLDEPSLGIAPALVTTIFRSIRRFADERGLGVLLLEQNIAQLLEVADRVYVMRSGRVILEETAAQMKQRDDYWDLF
jgi:branched-chain amino acid transport system ATP-binding protein